MSAISAYVKMCDKARCCLDMGAADGTVDEAADWVWDRLGHFRHRRGYTRETIRQMIADWREYNRNRKPSGRIIRIRL